MHILKRWRRWQEVAPEARTHDALRHGATGKDLQLCTFPATCAAPVACPRLPRKGQRRPTPPRRLLREQAAAPSRAATAPGRRSAGNQTERVTRVGGDRGGGTGAAAEGGASESLRFLLDLTAVSLGLLSVPTFSALAVS